MEGCTRMGENSGENKPCKEWGCVPKEGRGENMIWGQD